MANNAGGGSFTILDHSRETANMGFNTGAITAASIAGALTQFGALRTAVEGIINGVVAAEALYVNRSKLTNTPPSDPTAKRELKWLVTFEDTTEYFDPPTNAIPNAGFGKVFNVEVPCADDSITDIMIPNTDDADLTQTQMAAFVTAFEALCKSPYNGAVNVTRIQRVGRNT